MAIELDALKTETTATPEAPVLEAPEQAIETPERQQEAPESVQEMPVEAKEQLEEAEQIAVPAAEHVTVSPSPKDPVVQEIEDILSDGLGDLYKTLAENVKQTFREKGDEAAVMIKVLFESGKGTARKLFDVILDWLKVIPGVNKFFLEQEAKIKTDALLRYWNARQQLAAATI